MKKSLVVYYTWAGHTRGMAETIASLTGADVLEIRPETPYPKDYTAVVNQAKKEIREGYRPAIGAVDCDLTGYETVYIGTPIWWGTMAPPMATFLSANDCAGKTVMPFSTHGGGGKGHSDRDIAAMCPHADVRAMYTTYEGGGHAAKQELADWIDKNGLQ